MKVTFCSYDKPDNVGGPFTWIARLLPALRDRGIEVRCLLLLHWGETGPSLSALERAGIPCEAVLAHENTEDRIDWILEKLAEDPPDVFVPNLVVAALHAARYVREAGIPTVGVLHSDDPFYDAVIDRFIAGDPRDAVSAVVCVSRELERKVAGSGAKSATRRIPYGVPVPAEMVRRDPTRLRLAYAGRLVEEQKRITEVATSFLRVTRELPGCTAAIFGDGPDRESIEALIASDRESGRVTLHGPVPHDDLLRRFLDVDVIVLLSDYEGLPIVLLEAMACGSVPVCREMRSGIPELIDDGETGLLVDADEAAFDHAIQRLHRDSAFWQRLSAGARQKIVASYSEESSVVAWEDFLRELGAQRSPMAPISIPAEYHLPAVHPALASADARRVTTRRAGTFAGRLKKAVRAILTTGSR